MEYVVNVMQTLCQYFPGADEPLEYDDVDVRIFGYDSSLRKWVEMFFCSIFRTTIMTTTLF